MIRGCEVAALALALLYLGSRTLPRAWRSVNSDFPNYYTVARLVKDGFDTTRIYEWTWIQRQKDRLGIDQPLVATVSFTPFSFLISLPLAYFDPLTAKRVWTMFNLALAVSAAILLLRISGLKWHWIALLFLWSIPLHTNLILGQMYLLLLLLMVVALWLYLSGNAFSAGTLVGIAAGLKVFPVLFGLYFWRKRDWRAMAGLIASVAAIAALSIAVFGRTLVGEYVSQQLPSSVRGESVDAYNLTSNSLSSLLHRLFIFEPQLNPAPAIRAPWLAAVLHPLLQLLIFAPALLFIIPRDYDLRTLKVEWAVFTLAMLTVSSMPASYHFTVLLLPAAVMLGICREEQRLTLAALTVAIFVAVGFVAIKGAHLTSWHALFGVPRLYLLVAFCCIGYALLGGFLAIPRNKESLAWITVMLLGCVTSATLALRHQDGLFDDYRWRITINIPSYSASSPVSADSRSVEFIAMQAHGYSLTSSDAAISNNAPPAFDELSFASNREALVVEHTGATSRLIWRKPNDISPIENAHSPGLANDNSFVVFIRDEKGRGRLWARTLGGTSREFAVSDNDLNVMDVAVSPSHGLIFSAQEGGRPKLFEADPAGRVRLLSDKPDRFPAVSPDGRWLAFSRLQHGVWNLWVSDLHDSSARRISQQDCNQVSPSWEGDSKTLLYATDCGRGWMLTALARRQVIP